MTQMTLFMGGSQRVVSLEEFAALARGGALLGTLPGTWWAWGGEAWMPAAAPAQGAAYMASLQPAADVRLSARRCTCCAEAFRLIPRGWEKWLRGLDDGQERWSEADDDAHLHKPAERVVPQPSKAVVQAALGEMRDCRNQRIVNRSAFFGAFDPIITPTDDAHGCCRVCRIRSPEERMERRRNVIDLAGLARGVPASSERHFFVATQV